MKTLKSNLIAGLLGLVIGVTFWANDWIFKRADLVDVVSQASMGGRMPASEAISAFRSGSLAGERNLASLVADPVQSQNAGRELSSIGKDQGPLDDFRFGVLEGKYAVTLAEPSKTSSGLGTEIANGTINDISFIDNPNSEGRPAFVTDRAGFLNRYADILEIKKGVSKVSTAIMGRRIVETYKTKDALSNEIVLIRVEIDDNDRLYGIHVRKEAQEYEKNLLKL